MDDVIAEALKDSAGAATQVPDSQINLVSSLGIRQLQLEAEIKDMTERLAEKQAELKKVSEFELPNALIEMGTRGFTLMDGSKIEVQKIYTASIKASEKDNAYRWMRDNNHESLIKAEVKVEFDKGDVELAEKLMIAIKASIKKKGLDVPVELTQSVHWQTLRAFVREQIEAEELAAKENRPIPEADRLPRDLLGVYIIDKAKITPKK